MNPSSERACGGAGTLMTLSPRIAGCVQRPPKPAVSIGVGRVTSVFHTSMPSPSGVAAPPRGDV
jgi:hypothetical protein